MHADAFRGEKDIAPLFGKVFILLITGKKMGHPNVITLLSIPFPV